MSCYYLFYKYYYVHPVGVIVVVANVQAIFITGQHLRQLDVEIVLQLMPKAC